jgi:RNA polymerase sigma-70 factor (ECF subfamily)
MRKLITPAEQMYLLETAYKENLPGLLAFARRFVPEDVAGDLVQDVFVRIWQGARTFLDIPDGSSRKTYLYRAVRNVCRDWLKHQVAIANHANEALYLLKIDETDHNATLTAEEFEQRMSRVERLIDQLPERCREIFIMHYRQRRPNAEIAEYFAISKRTVEAQLYKALQTLRSSLSGEKE